MPASETAFPRIDPDEAIRLVTELMAVPGKSCQEGQILETIRQRLLDAGIPDDAMTVDQVHRKSPAGGETGNLIVKLPGTQRGPRRLLMAHLDTVPLCVGCEPIRDGEFIRSANPKTALGADNRAGVAVVLNSLLEIQRQQLPHPPLTLFWPVQEEIGLLGARLVGLSRLGRPKLCFNWDGGTPEMVTIGATGDIAMEITVHGIASHAGAHPEGGVSTAAIAGVAIADLVQNGWHGLIVKGRRTGTSNIGAVSGGEATNVVMPHLRLRAEARSHDPKFRRQIVEAYRQAFEKAARAIRNDRGQTGRIEFQSDLKYESFRLSEEEPSVKTAQAAIEALGLKPELKVGNGGLDANWLSARGLPTVTLGCGQQSVHTVDERLHLDSFLKACQTGLLLATGMV